MTRLRGMAERTEMHRAGTKGTEEKGTSNAEDAENAKSRRGAYRLPYA
jgi:hypothetical protein